MTRRISATIQCISLQEARYMCNQKPHTHTLITWKFQLEKNYSVLSYGQTVCYLASVYCGGMTIFTVTIGYIT